MWSKHTNTIEHHHLIASKSTNYLVMFNSFVKLPECNYQLVNIINIGNIYIYAVHINISIYIYIKNYSIYIFNIANYRYHHDIYRNQTWHLTYQIVLLISTSYNNIN